MKRRFLYTVLIIFALISLQMYVHAQAIIKGKLTGNGEPLPSATVSMGNKIVLSGLHGEFLFSVSSGIYTIIITHTGYQKIVQQIKIERSTTETIDFIMTPGEQMGEVVVLGSRNFIQRSNLNTPVAVDVLSSKNLLQTGQASLTQMLNFSAPSLNVSQQLVNEPITLRGLDPDHVLILVNGTRYHNMAYLNDGRVRGILGKGSVANDLNAIPFSAIEKIEVLRDGASAQYGSDAIAGVINIILKRSIDKTSVQLHSGQNYRGDGENISMGMNRGISLNKKGSLNLSANFQYRNPTYRGGEFKGTIYKTIPSTATHIDSVRIISQDDSIVEARNFNRKDVSNAGTSKLRGFGVLVNGNYIIKKSTELFWTASANNRKTNFIGTYILPKNISRVNTDLFPNGFKGISNHKSSDVSGIAGAKGEIKKWHWEYSSAYGNNTDRYYAENTNNPSQFFTLGKNAPTSFYTGTLIYQQLTNNINFSKQLSERSTWIKLFNIAFGAEARLENYRIKAGEEAAWKNYNSLGSKFGGAQHGLIFQPGDVVNKNQNIVGGYIDVEAEIKNHFLLNLASRYEYYSSFGGNLAGKLAARYKFTDHFSLRSSISNGFRAPYLQQRYYSTTTRGVRFDNGSIVPVTNGIFNNNSIVAQAFGIPSLQPEKSVNFTTGFTAALLNHINFTVDAYWIQIKNRIVLSGVFDRKLNKYVDSILFLNNAAIDQLQFFSNAINTRTHGVDIVLNGNWKIKKSNFAVMLAGNFTQTQLFGPIKTAGKLRLDSLNTNTLFSREEIVKLEEGQPSDKVILSLNYKVGKIGILFRNSRFGRTTMPFNNNRPDEHFSPKILTDFSITYTPNTWVSITAGSNNIFNVYPDRIKDYRNTGDGIFLYGPEAMPFGFNGGYYYLNIDFKF
ncbi:MAG: TonB-dependent receptor [Chitinophagaceae bacterium]|nr:TonB-dependent receptor [Chitinophagaceae bacterium]